MSYGHDTPPGDIPGSMAEYGPSEPNVTGDDSGLARYWDAVALKRARLEEIAEELLEIHHEGLLAAGWSEHESELYDAQAKVCDVDDIIRRRS